MMETAGGTRRNSRNDYVIDELPEASRPDSAELLPNKRRVRSRVNGSRRETESKSSFYSFSGPSINKHLQERAQFYRRKQQFYDGISNAARAVFTPP